MHVDNGVITIHLCYSPCAIDVVLPLDCHSLLRVACIHWFCIHTMESCICLPDLHLHFCCYGSQIVTFVITIWMLLRLPLTPMFPHCTTNISCCFLLCRFLFHHPPCNCAMSMLSPHFQIHHFHLKFCHLNQPSSFSLVTTLILWMVYVIFHHNLLLSTQLNFHHSSLSHIENNLPKPFFQPYFSLLSRTQTTIPCTLKIRTPDPFQDHLPNYDYILLLCPWS